MGWMFLGLYVVLGIVSARICLRWMSEEFKSTPLSSVDLFAAVLMFFTWPFSLLVLSIILGRFFPSRKDSESEAKFDSRLRKFAGLPPRKENEY